MRKKILTRDINYVKYQADQLESMIKQRSHQRRVLIKFIKLHRNISTWSDMMDTYLCRKCDSALVEKCRKIISRMEEKAPT